MNGILVALVAFLIFALVFSLFVGLGALLLMWAWNLIIMGLFHGPHIGFWQSLAVSVLVGTIRQMVTVTVNRG